ncbi:uncharacterized BrkB/YihY/UPF0761 family membrane protein [Sinorhizobium kostiense]|uniref:Uncharacterized BrkB/YihY/UPF0761 family membrane protein n=1 Tax=Sinorhizobium kostiense TaxID=76747 RepID=A0ABS4QXE3_9HYPH|nr:hypothetical protein [Sinorhizobium kostiense]MBP2235317.1 uncharacterized BrkB/YihY/UPF0761 family membrane protein [Sinorhizobium kostiense]
MSIIYTIVIIIGFLITAPFLAVGMASILIAAVVGLLFFFVVTLVGVEPSGGVLVTCFVMACLTMLIYALGKKADKPHE